eukprot:4137750-Prymnesium_polylepis.1
MAGDRSRDGSTCTCIAKACAKWMHVPGTRGSRDAACRVCKIHTQQHSHRQQPQCAGMFRTALTQGSSRPGQRTR